MGYRENLRRERIARGLSQARMAEAAGVALNTIGQIERGDSSPTIDTLEAIASALGLELGDLIGESVAPANADLCVPIPCFDETESADSYATGNTGSGTFHVPGHLASPSKAVVRVRTDTMYPTLWPGDTVLVDSAVKKPKSGSIVLVEIEGLSVLRRLRRIKRQLMFAADNPLHPPHLTEGDESHRILGVAVALLLRDLTTLRFR